jgi:hypothetical protein
MLCRRRELRLMSGLVCFAEQHSFPEFLDAEGKNDRG